MPDYRGGDRGMSGYGADLVKDIRNGNTQRQQDRNLRNKIIVNGAQAGLQAFAGYAKGQQSIQDENDKKRSIMQQAIANAKKASFAQDGAQRAAMPMQSPFQDMARSAMDNAVAKGRENAKVNDAASMAPVNGIYTPGGLGAHLENVETGAQDLNTSNDLINHPDDEAYGPPRPGDDYTGNGTGLGGSVKTWGNDS